MTLALLSLAYSLHSDSGKHHMRNPHGKTDKTSQEFPVFSQGNKRANAFPPLGVARLRVINLTVFYWAVILKRKVFPFTKPCLCVRRQVGITQSSTEQKEFVTIIFQHK